MCPPQELAVKRLVMYSVHYPMCSIHRYFVLMCLCVGEAVKILSALTREQLVECGVAVATRMDLLRPLQYCLSLRPLLLQGTPPSHLSLLLSLPPPSPFPAPLSPSPLSPLYIFILPSLPPPLLFLLLLSLPSLPPPLSFSCSSSPSRPSFSCCSSPSPPLPSLSTLPPLPPSLPSLLSLPLFLLSPLSHPSFSCSSSSLPPSLPIPPLICML